VQDSAYFNYDGERGRHVSFPLGGIGAGCIGLSAAGRLVDWEIANRPDKGALNGFSHFAIRAEAGGKTIDTRILNGPFAGNFSGDRGAGNYREFGWGVRREYLTGLPHFRSSSFRAFFPAAELTFEDAKFPGNVELLAFSPFIPMDEAASSLPVALFEFAVTNTSSAPIRYSLIGCLGNPMKGPHASRLVRNARFSGMVNAAANVPTNAREFGQVLIATDRNDVSSQHEWYRGSWFDSLEVYWKDISTAGTLKDRIYDRQHVVQRLDGGGRHRGHSCLAAHETVAPGERTVFRWAIAWYVPNVERDWLSVYGYADEPKEMPLAWKTHYATAFADVDSIAAYTFDNWERLAAETLRFRDALQASTLPDSVLDAVSANLSILKSPAVLRLQDGTFYGFEGCDVTAGSCEGSCTHVWNYQQALPFLFPGLERGMRTADFAHNQDPRTGGMSFRLALPLGIGRFDIRACADGQFGNVMKAYRDWKVSGDDAWLRNLWPAIQRAIEFAWHPGNPDRWDPERTGVLWGRQHHTLDMELFGPNAWLTGFYLGALLAGARMAQHLGETAKANEYLSIFDKGKRWVDEHLFNGRYFVQKLDIGAADVLDGFESGPDSPVLTGSIHDLYWSEEHGQIKYQIAEGCLLDQVVAQWHADLYGLGELFDPGKVATTLQSMYAFNFKPRLADVVNPCRVFGLEEESGTVVCDWPPGALRPVIPVPYSQETFHGLEYAFGAMLMGAGEVARGVRVFRAVRDRYRGDNRNPWNEMECGSNYVRSMAAYAGLHALSGFAFDLTIDRIAFAPRVQSSGRFQSFWAVGSAWGEAAFEEEAFDLRVLGGDIRLARIGLPFASDGSTVAVNGCALESTFDPEAADTVFAAVHLSSGDCIALRNPRLSLRHLPELSEL
jgi:non-lysosomal glucosylceramidase